MKTLFLSENASQLEALQSIWQHMEPKLLPYIDHLFQEYSVQELPRTLVLTDAHTATYGLSDIPLPAYTNDYRIVFAPQLGVWKAIYLRQLDAYPAEATAALHVYYETQLSENHLLQILGHELAHHSELFLTDEDYETGIWFEEGMVEYISSRYFLTDAEFAAAKDAARQLTALFRAKHGWHSLEAFGQQTYANDYASIFYEYQRSFLAIDALVQRLGSVQAVFDEYKKWHDHPVDLSLTEWFRIDL